MLSKQDKQIWGAQVRIRVIMKKMERKCPTIWIHSGIYIPCKASRMKTLNLQFDFLALTWRLDWITGKGNFFGYEIKATATMVNYEAGPIVVHLAAGISSGTKIEDGTIESRFLGCGTKIGKRIGLSIFDSELSIETLALFGKSWHWGTRK